MLPRLNVEQVCLLFNVLILLLSLTGVARWYYRGSIRLLALDNSVSLPCWGDLVVQVVRQCRPAAGQEGGFAMSKPEIDLGERLGVSKSIADQVHERAREVKKGLKQNAQQADEELIAHRATMFVLDDRATDLREEAGQLDVVIHGITAEPVVETPAPAAEPPPPAPAPVAEPEPVPEPQGLGVEPAAEKQAGNGNATATKVVAKDRTNSPSLSDPRYWGVFVWIVAIFAAIVGLLIAGLWPVDQWIRAETGGNGLLLDWFMTMLWWLGWPLLLGGMAGSFAAHRNSMVQY